jgi:hypothetical protein
VEALERRQRHRPVAAPDLMAIAAPVALAQEADTEVDAQGRVHYRFRTIDAAGSGLAHLHGRYVQEGSIGTGMLSVSAKAHARVDGFDRRVLLGEHVLYLGARGQFRVAGDDISSTLNGANIRFEADGEGAARFAGDGSYSVDGGPRQPWS